MGHIYLIIAVIALGCLGVFHKVADHRKCRPEAINLGLFVGAGLGLSIVTTFQLGPAAWGSIPLPAIAVGAICGLFASIAVLQFQHGVRYGRISTSWFIVNLSTVVPTILSILVYKEAVTPRRAAALLLALAALFLLWIDRRTEETVHGVKA